ncbi:MAG TPA: hypothetical protein ENH10_06670, partial [Bacteroidetes bacterium]|nr:hypothetical protein [Bacteroidota bacterium]HEX04825.1 hypothetical protein [Bacteroidota bacterium]
MAQVVKDEQSPETPSAVKHEASPPLRKSPGILPDKPVDITLAEAPARIDVKRVTLLLVGLLLFTIVYLSPSWSSAVDPVGDSFELTREGKAAIGLFLL